MNLYRALVKFPNVPAAHCFQEASVKASGWSAAVRQAIEQTMQRPHLKGRQHQQIELSIQLVRRDIDPKESA